MTLQKYGSIEQFRHAVREIDKRGLKTVKFYGTVKLHGTNAAIGYDIKDNKLWYQSRNRVLTVDSDNHDFVKCMSESALENMVQLHQDIEVHLDLDCVGEIIVYGEWIGQGVQSKVGVSEIPKEFVVFDILVDGDWLSTVELCQLFSLSNTFKSVYEPNLPLFELVYDSNNPQQAQNQVVNSTNQVEEKCPYAWNIHGIEGVGEGIVWKSQVMDDGHRIKFKTKGQKHSTSKVKTVSEVDMVALQTARELSNAFITERRLEQGIEYLNEMNLPVTEKSTGEFLRWVVNDVHKEEYDIIEKADVQIKMLNREMSTTAREWLFKRINNDAFKTV